MYAQSHHEEIKPISKYRSCKGKFDSLRTIQFPGVCQSPLTTVNTHIHTCVQRRRSSTPEGEQSGDEGYVPYVPLKERRKAEVRTVY